MTSESWFREHVRQENLRDERVDEIRARNTQRQFSELELKLAVNARKILWDGAWLSVPEDARIEELERICTNICGGDAQKGNTLATQAVWS